MQTPSEKPGEGLENREEDRRLGSAGCRRLCSSHGPGGGPARSKGGGWEPGCPEPETSESRKPVFCRCPAARSPGLGPRPDGRRKARRAGGYNGAAGAPIHFRECKAETAFSVPNEAGSSARVGFLSRGHLGGMAAMRGAC